MDTARAAGEKFERLVTILGALRGENGCPWDKEQDASSLLNYFLEEVYEAAEALRQGSAEAVCEELGDVLMEVVFLCRIFEEQGAFSAADALESINRKMVGRHPHVFGGESCESSQRVLEEWQRGKLREKKRESLLDGLPRYLPALLAAFQLGQRAASVGFDWPGPEEALSKVKEELEELEKALVRRNVEEVHRELGDLFFALANVARQLKVNPELALVQANEKFRRRFVQVERRLKDQGLSLGQATLAEMDAAWDEVKAGERLE
ncbi:MAG: nucleoside triphosphate pyrophosphohydrolase [Candidatus Aminicenantes bacterium]|nr:nucleoside triphosphate pyrophosphohydrolase [Candidatus Aminicenantes bacterium]